MKYNNKYDELMKRLIAEMNCRDLTEINLPQAMFLLNTTSNSIAKATCEGLVLKKVFVRQKKGYALNVQENADPKDD